MKIISVNQVIRQINECERLANLYNQIYEILSCPGYEQPDMNETSRKLIDKKLANGEIRSLEELGIYLDDLADDEYRRAHRLLNNDFRRAI